MATSDYCTLAQLKRQILNANTYTATTLSFTAATKKIADSAQGLKRFTAGMRIQISGSGSNNGYFTIATGNVASEIVVNETLVNEVAGATVVITDVSDPTDDVQLAALITAASRQVDKDTGRIFYKRPSSETETRYFTATSPDQLFIDDCISISELVTDSKGDRTYTDVWAITDYDLQPFNAANNVEPEPYTSITRAPNGNYYFPCEDGFPNPQTYYRRVAMTSRYSKAVRIKGVWGWSATPSLITQATLLQAHRWFKRKDAIFGVMGSAEMGQVLVMPKLDPDIALMLKNYRKLQFG